MIDNDSEIQEFTNWIKAKYSVPKLEIYDVKLVVSEARQQGIEVDNKIRTALVLLMTQNNATPKQAVELFRQTQQQKNGSLVDELIETTLKKLEPHIQEAAAITKAEVAARFMEVFNQPSGVTDEVEQFGEQQEAHIVSTLQARKQRLATRFQNLLSGPQEVDIEAIVAKGNTLAQQDNAYQLPSSTNLLRLPSQNQKEA